MRRIIITFLAAFLVCSFCVQGEEVNDIQTKILTIARQIADDIPAWKMTDQDLPEAESPDLDDAGWLSVRPRQTIRDKTFWLRYTLKVPELFAGTRVKGTRLRIEFLFRGLGVYEAQIHLDGRVLDSLRLEFGNQSTELKHEFHLTEDAQPDEKIVLALRLDNLGRLPLKAQKEAEPGTYFQIREARLDYEAVRETRDLLGRLVLDMQVGAMLLDLEGPPDRPSSKQRPVAVAYKKASGSETFQRLQQTFAAAVRDFSLEALALGEFPRVKQELAKFYTAVSPVSRWVKTFRIFTAGNAHIDLAWLWRWPETVEVARATFSTIMDNMEEYPDIVFILYGLGDHGGGPNREMLDRVKGYERQRIFPEIKHSLFADYIGQVRRQDQDALPVWEDELYLEYHRGTYTTQAETKKFNRKSEVLLQDAEKFSALAYHSGKSYPSECLKGAWHKVLMNQFHDILPGSSINPVYKDARESYLAAQASARRALDAGLRYLASKVDTANGVGLPLLVFNSLAWERDGLVRVKLPGVLRGTVLVLDPSGREVPSQTLDVEGERELCFIAHAVPSLGYRVYRIKEGEGRSSLSSLIVRPTTLENRFFRVRLDPESGNIISVFDKGQNREVLAPTSQGNQIQLFEDIPSQWDAWNIGYTGRSWTLDNADSIELGGRGPVWASLLVKKNYLGLSKARREPAVDFPSSFFTQEIILYDSLPTIEVAMRADWWEDHVLCKVAFPVDVQSARATYEIPFAAIERPTTRNTDWERARFEVPAIRWADLSDNGYGVSLINESKYGYDIKDNVLRLTLFRSPLWPDPMADRGKHELAYALYPHRGDWREADTVRRGYEFNTPLHAVFTEPHPGDWPASMSFFEVSADNIVLAAVKKSEDRESLILRLYESEGRETSTPLRMFFTPKKIFLLDLMENRQESLDFEDKTAELRFKKWEVKTLEILKE